MSKEKILLVSCGGLGNGGVQAVMMQTVRNLSRKFVFDALLFTDEKRYYDDSFLSYGGKIIRIPHYVGNNRIRRKLDYYLRGVRLYYRIKKQIARNGPYKAIHCNNQFESALCVKAAYECGVPVRIVHTHVITSASNPLQAWLNSVYLKIIKKYATALVGCSQEACDSMYGVGSASLVIPNPYDEIKFCPDREGLELPREFVLLQVGSFNNNKNQIFSIRVLAEIKKRYPDVKLNLIGFDTGRYQNEMETVITELNVIDDVKILASDADVAKYLENAAAFIFPSRKEGFGIALIEAQAMGVTCYTSDTLPSLSDRGGCVYLSLDIGPKAWADRIIENYEAFRGQHKHYDCSKFASAQVMGIVDRLYSGTNYESGSSEQN